ncbi:MAG: hypothetical protein QOH36_2494 [Actinomycetota bacterium]|nr:hypothetical protein [Actinomycetota bacterium]
MASEHNESKEEEMVGPIDRALTFAENVLYTVSALLLLAGAVAVLGEIGYNLVHELDEGVADAVVHSLDGLLLVFILLELLAAVRATMVEHRLVAEPFLVAGIIASIKEIIVLSLEAAEFVGKEGEGFRHAMTGIGVLGGIVLLLAVATFLVRRKEREPEEEEKGSTGEQLAAEPGKEQAAGDGAAASPTEGSSPAG